MADINNLDHLSQTELALLWGVSTRTIQRLPELPSLRHGSGHDSYYVWSEFLALQKSRMSQGGAGNLSHADRLKKIQADDAELDLEVKKKTILPADPVRRVWANECAAMRARLLSIPSTAAMRINSTHSQAQREGIIRKDIYEALDCLKGESLD
jgi:phage terminase Nu1 subunit (DNA packaging protein)